MILERSVFCTVQLTINQKRMIIPLVSNAIMALHSLFHLNTYSCTKACSFYIMWIHASITKSSTTFYETDFQVTIFGQTGQKSITWVWLREIQTPLKLLPTKTCFLCKHKAIIPCTVGTMSMNRLSMNHQVKYWYNTKLSLLLRGDSEIPSLLPQILTQKAKEPSKGISYPVGDLCKRFTN